LEKALGAFSGQIGVSAEVTSAFVEEPLSRS